MKRTRRENIRAGILILFMCLFGMTAVARLLHLQVLNFDEYTRIVERQSSGRVPIPAGRGNIYDRYGRLVAKDVAGAVLCAYPHDEKELNRCASYLERRYNLKPGTARKKFGLGVQKFRYINRRLSDEDASGIAVDAPAGLYLRKESRREYPFGITGKQILGFTDIDNTGQSGFELAFDSLLAGKNGWADVRRDGLRNTFRVHESAMVKPIRGSSVVLSLDWRLQGIVEDELREAVDEYGARSAMAAFVDCASGDILALAHYDPNESNPDRPSKCRAVTDQFEPGSALKAFTAAGLLDAGLVDFADSTFCENGVWKIGRRRLRDDKELGWLDFREIMELSSNIGIGKYAIELGGEELYQTLSRFALGKTTACGLPGEGKGVLRRLRWSDFNVASLAMGHSVAVTTLQAAMGMAAIANGGELMQAHLVFGSVDEHGRVGDLRRPVSRGRVIDEKHVDTLRALLRAVVERGTAAPANSPSVAIAGKTGTAEIPDLKNKRYFKNRFMASFLGYFPASSPIIAGMVVLEDPRPITYGGYTAGPAFRRVAERYIVSNPDLFAVPDQTLPAQRSSALNTLEVPDFVGRDLILAKTMADERGIQLRCSPSEGVVEWQYPPPDRLLLKNDKVIVTSRHDGTANKMVDLVGLTIRQASAFLSHMKVSCVIKGNGQVVRQSVPPGCEITTGMICQLECRPG
ncbi:MAG: hypothetical protein JSU65_07255 [Candidatus Zixiibacteriota bacterium]|nr:MAG: hypothetical protein JSU65_07255 [candidate division Zixibacteria bacterium]